MKPLIGVNVDIRDLETRRYCLSQAYVKAITAAGGVPILIPPQIENIATIVEMLDGVMLTGGDDYDPSMYGEEAHPNTKVGFEDRQKFDMALASYVLNQTELPVLGICAGAQITNIALGGTLVQDVPTVVPESQVTHGENNGAFNSHKVSLSSNSKLQGIYGAASIETPTWHHQAVKTPGKGLSIVSWAEDGVSEAIELDGERFVVGVQWHPEQDLDNHLCLFRAFVTAAVPTVVAEKTEELAIV